MNTKTLCLSLALPLTAAAHAQTKPEPHLAHANSHEHEAGHGSEVWHSASMNLGYGHNNHSEAVSRAELDAWVGTDLLKLKFDAELEQEDSKTQRLELTALASLAVSTFWDAQAGVRLNTQPESVSYAVVGFEGLAPYFVETKAHLLAGEQSDVFVETQATAELLITKKLVLEPFVTLETQLTKTRALHKDKGFSRLEAGLNTHYQVTPAFKPFVELRYETLLGDTKDLAQTNAEQTSSSALLAGAEFLF